MFAIILPFIQVTLSLYVPLALQTMGFGRRRKVLPEPVVDLQAFS